MVRSPIFRAELEAGKLRFPIALHTAVRRERVRFHLLHEKDGGRLRREMVCSAEDEPVPAEERVRGWEAREGQFVILEREDLRAAKAETDRRIEIHHFVRVEELDPRRIARGWRLSAGDGGEGYAALAAALSRARRAGICRWAFRGRVRRGALCARGGRLRLLALRHAGEVVAVDDLDLPETEAEPDHLDAAIDLIEAMSDGFDPSDWINERQKRIRELVQRKAAGEEPELEEPEEKTPTTAEALRETLRESLERAKAA